MERKELERIGKKERGKGRQKEKEWGKGTVGLKARLDRDLVEPQDFAQNLGMKCPVVPLEISVPLSHHPCGRDLCA